MIRARMEDDCNNESERGYRLAAFAAEPRYHTARGVSATSLTPKGRRN